VQAGTPRPHPWLDYHRVLYLSTECLGLCHPVDLEGYWNGDRKVFCSPEDFQLVAGKEQMLVGGTRKVGYFLESLFVTSKQQKSIFLHGHEYVVGLVLEVGFEKIYIVGRL
jgi:hypothetical protein